MKLSVQYLKDSSIAWLASNVAHEGQHQINKGRFRGKSAWKDEQLAVLQQMFSGVRLGLTAHEIKHLLSIVDDKAWLQNHMEKGFKY